MIWIPVGNEAPKLDIPLIGTKAFLVLCYLMTVSIDFVARTSVGDISKNVGIKTTRKIKELLGNHIDHGYIAIDNADMGLAERNTFLQINVLYQQKVLESKGYEQMPIELFQKWVGTIGDKGWALFSMLSIYYNDNFGYAFPNQKTIVSALKIGRTTLTKVTQQLQDCRLIKILPQDKTFIRTRNTYGQDITEFVNNRYIVNHKKYSRE